MAFAILTDTTANLPNGLLQKHAISTIPFSYFFQGEERICTDLDAFDGPGYYAAIRGGAAVSTSQITPQRYLEYMVPLLKEGKDILFIGISSGISGSFSSAEMAAQELKKAYPNRNIRLVDTLGASLGEGLLVLRAAAFRENGMTLNETANMLLSLRHRMYQIFTVDDLMFLRRSGRCSGISAIFGTMLQIKPLLKGNEKGKIVISGKVRGRKNAIKRLAESFVAMADQPQMQTVGIAHADCPEDAAFLQELLEKAPAPPKEILTVCYEPVTGSHVGPGTLALFFEGETGVRKK